MEDAGVKFLANDNISQHVDGLDKSQMKAALEQNFKDMLRILRIDQKTDHNTNGTPERIARMFVDEVFAGRYNPCPKITTFPNEKEIDQIYTSNAITVRSCCSHHFVPIIGKCWIGIVPGKELVGLSKLNRLVNWFARRPQIQEELTAQIADKIEELIQPKGIAVIIKAQHGCVVWRGVNEGTDATMSTSIMRGCFEKPEARAEFMSLIKL